MRRPAHEVGQSLLEVLVDEPDPDALVPELLAEDESVDDLVVLEVPAVEPDPAESVL